MVEVVGSFIAGVAATAAVIGLYLKRREALYPKRVAVYRCTQEFLSRAWADPDADSEALLGAFHRCKTEARFLFGKRFARYLDELYEGVERHFHLELRLQIEADTLDDLTKETLEHHCFASRHWLAEANMQLEDRFAKYLKM